MLQSKLAWIGTGLGLGLVLTACPAGDDSGVADTGGQTGGMTETMTMTAPMTESETTPATESEGPAECLGVGGAGADGDACTSNGDCMSGVCLAFQDVPPDPNATCGVMPEDCSTHITATLYDFSAIVDNGAPEPLGGTQIRVVKALEAITDPVGAVPIAEATPGGDGQMDVVTAGPISSPIAIIAVAGGGDYFLTATAVSGEVEMGAYDVGTGIHEFWAVRQTTLDSWQTALEGDPDAASQLDDGLGVSGGVIGFVRDTDGNPVEGATVAADSDSSGTTIRFPQDDGTMTADMTGPSGTFVILKPVATGEDFTATAGGMSGGGTAGTANNVIFTLILTLQ